MGDSRCRPAVGGPRRAPGWAALAAVALVLAGCDRGSDAAPPGATVREDTTPQTTATTTPADPYAVPEVIDAAYVDRVLAALYKVDGDAARIIVREGDIALEAAETLKAVYADDELNDQLRLWGEAIRERFEGLHNPPGDIGAKVREILSSTPACLFIIASSDYGARAGVAPPPSDGFLALVAKPAGRDPGNRNPTPWVISLDVVSLGGSAPEDPCRNG